MAIHFSFMTIVVAIVKLFMLMAAGYAVYRMKQMTDQFVDMLSQILMNVIFPALIIHKTISHFSFQEYGSLWISLPLLGIIFSAAGMLLAAPFALASRGFSSKKEFISSVGFQNCGYLPMTIILFSFTGIIMDKLLVYMFLFIIGFNLFFFSFVPPYFSGKLKSSFRLSQLFSPPVAGTLFALLWVALFGKGSMPDLIMDPLGQLGQASFPLSMFVLGAYLCKYSAHFPENALQVFLSSVLKMLIFPAIVLFVLLLLRNIVAVDLSFFLFLQAIMPAAVTLVVVGSFTGSDNKFLSSTVFYTHLFSILSVPLWFEAYRLLFNI